MRDLRRIEGVEHGGVARDDRERRDDRAQQHRRETGPGETRPPDRDLKARGRDEIAEADDEEGRQHERLDDAVQRHGAVIGRGRDRNQTDALEELVEAEHGPHARRARRRSTCGRGRARRAAGDPAGTSRRSFRGDDDAAPHGLVAEAAVLVAEKRDGHAAVRVSNADLRHGVEIDLRANLET